MISHEEVRTRVQKKLELQKKFMTWSRYGHPGCGAYIVHDRDSGAVIATVPDLMKCGRELGVLADDEMVAAE